VFDLFVDLQSSNLVPAGIPQWIPHINVAETIREEFALQGEFLKQGEAWHTNFKIMSKPF
jgi:hypothetical protein